MQRRAFFLAWAPVLAAQSTLDLPQSGFAFYDKRTRWTSFPVVVGNGWRWLVYEHDGGWISPYAGAMQQLPGEAGAPKIQLRVEAGRLEAWERRGERVRVIRALMAAPRDAVVLYPRDAHGDMTALWSFGEGVYFTNRDWKNVYRVPEGALRGRVKPQR